DLSFAQAFELARLELRLLPLPLALGRPWRRRGGALGPADGHEAEHGIHELQGALDLVQPLRGGAVLEEDVERPVLPGDRVGELSEAPLLHLAHRPALLFDQLLDARGQLFLARVALLGMNQDERLIAAVRHAQPPSVRCDSSPAPGPGRAPAPRRPPTSP